MKREIPDKNLFMMCERLYADALSELPSGYTVRSCRRDELNLWKGIHFDDQKTAAAYEGFMTSFFHDVYEKNEDLFFQKCLFVCDEGDKPIGTCFIWKVYDAINTVHWFKVIKGYEDKGIGRALLSIVMKELKEEDYPVFLHTQPSSYRAIKLYTDFGFALLSDPQVGQRQNDLSECLPILEEYMTPEAYKKLRIAKAPAFFLDAVRSSNKDQF